MSLESERAVLGTILLEPQQLATVLRFAAIEDFSLSSHREILRTIVGLDRRGIAPDLVTVVAELDQVHKLGSVGGPAYVAGLLDGVRDRANPEAYATKVHDLARGNVLHAAARCACASIEQGESVDDVLGRLQQKELELIRANTRGARPIKDAALDFLNQFYAACGADGPDIKLTTSLLDLDAKTGGLQPGTLVIVGGRTGGGKSAFLQQMAFAQAKEGRRVYFSSLEMTEHAVLARGVSMLTNIPTSSILSPRYLTKDQKHQITEAIAEIQTWPIVIDDAGGLQIHQVIANCRSQINKGAECVYIDYLQMIGCREYTKSYDQVTAVSGALRDLAKTSNVPVVAACQLHRPGDENDRPTLFDCKNSGAIENDASLLLAVYRPKDGSTYTGGDEILVLKQRNGITGPVAVSFCGSTMRFKPRGC
ncbi:MAG: replicative DNA helicase [Terriglobales bacterium]